EPVRVLRAAGLSLHRSALSSPPVPLSAMRRGGTVGRARGLLKIQDGCDEHCTFCATTIARGANRSRPTPELVEEAKALAEHHAEIVLTGVHIGTYGQDWELGAGSRTTRSLGVLLEALIAAVPDVRYRLSSIE